MIVSQDKAIDVKQSATAVNLPPKLNPTMESKEFCVTEAITLCKTHAIRLRTGKFSNNVILHLVLMDIRSKIKEKAQLTEIFFKYGLQTPLTSKEES
ncbi:hypothetical protein V6N12_066497 [Hibiscus sabdariffa]|uniref:Uncharacterized protein n=1 Tax=Hibiscus sabdariffa TaxID=183260 RepID=A0ABR2CQC4_9ROSI